MPLSVAYALAATACPAVTVPAGILDPTPGNNPTPVMGTEWVAGAVPDMHQKLNELAVRINNLARYGGGGLAIVSGCTIAEHAATGLTADVAAGMIQSSGQVPVAAQSKALTNASYNYLWSLRTGVVAAPVIGSTSPPGGATDPVYLGRMRTVGGNITEIDRSGVVESRYGMLFRRTGDTGAPGDTPPAGVILVTETAGGLYLWDGASHRLVSDQLPTTGGTLTGGVVLPNVDFGALVRLSGWDGAQVDSLFARDLTNNIATLFGAMPHGASPLNAYGATALGAALAAYATDYLADQTNTLRALLYAASDRWGLVQEATGTGVVQPFYLRIGALDVFHIGVNGELFVRRAGLPTSDPHQDGQVWLNSGVMTVSSG